MIQKIQYLVIGIISTFLLLSCEDQMLIDESLPLRDKIDQLVEPVVTFGSPGAIIIGVIKNGERTIYSYGDAGLGNGAPQPNTIFEIASNTKTFTATLLSTFIDEGLVSMDDSIKQFLPSYVHPPTYNGKHIKLRDLATHTSGLPRSAKTFNTDVSLLSNSTNDDFYNFLNDISVSAYPFNDYTNGNELPNLGTHYMYSNIGIGVLGHILELASGQAYEQLIEERICSPLNMPDTRIFVDLTEEQKSRIPKGYSINQKEISQPRDWGRYLGTGALFSTMDDMLNYIEANMDNSTSLSKSMQKCQDIIYSKEDLVIDKDIIFEADGIGMTWMVNHSNGDTIVMHNGLYNHYNKIKFNRTKKVGVVIFSNGYSNSTDLFERRIFNWINE